MDFLRGAGLHLPPPQKITTAIYKKYIKAYYLIFKLLFIISREYESFCINNRELRFQIITSFWDACGYIRRLIYNLLRLYSSCRTTLPKLFLSTLKKQSLCAVLSRSCSTSNEQRAPRMQSIRLWAAARSTARFLSSVPKSTFRNNWGRLKAAEPKARASSRNASTVIRTISAFRSANIIGRFAITMPTSRPKKVKNAWLGMGERYRTLAEVFEHDTNDLFKRIGVDRSESTWWRYRASLGHLRAFLKHEYNLHDIPLLELEQSFIEQYHVYLKTVCHLKAGSACRYIDCLNNVVKISFNNGLIPRNPFAFYSYSAPTEPRTFLSEEVLRIFQTTRLRSAKHEYHRDLFLFSCFTEICYKDMHYLTCEQIIPDTKGHLRMHGNRCKTGGEYTINFLPTDLRLLEKYRGTVPSSLAFDMPGLSSINCSLRRITKQCGIPRHITFHAARHYLLSYSLKISSLYESLY